ncbi:MAG: hypothetical protein AUG16_05870 [Thaumarchaeota archaeon 13_1_20CM_2_39_20]|nr:MAG: hypothetical protein AUG16_05870 [Thaumarchaeota archaeon 13_1_20CM_2_39_20]
MSLFLQPLFLILIVFSLTIVISVYTMETAFAIPECTGHAGPHIDWSSCKIVGENLNGADLNGSNLSGSYLEHVDLGNANMGFTDLSNSNFKHVDLSFANLQYANLNGTTFYDVNFQFTDLGFVNLQGRDLSKVDWTDASFYSTSLQNTNFSHAHLKGANLSSANLTGANLEGADLSHVELNFADLHGADLQNANLTEAYLDHKTDFRNVDLRYVDLTGVNMTAGDFTGADLRGAKLPAGFVLPPPAEKPQSPKKQIELGTIKCKDSLVLFIRSNGHMACAKLGSIQKLAERGIMATGANTTSSIVGKPMNVTEVIRNLDSLYGKWIMVYGNYFQYWPFPKPTYACSTYEKPNTTVDESFYTPAGRPYLGDIPYNPQNNAFLTIQLVHNRIQLTGYDESLTEQKLVIFGGILEKTQARGINDICERGPIGKSASLVVNLNQQEPNIILGNSTISSISIDPVSGNSPLSVTFHIFLKSPRPPLLNVVWSFGNTFGIVGDSGDTVTHVYTTPGIYHGSVTVSEGGEPYTPVPIVLDKVDFTVVVN